MKNIFKTIEKKVKDFFDVKKYKKQKNTFENKYLARNEQYIELLETIPMLVKKLESYEAQIKEQKKDIKEYKRIIEEDMIPKKKKRG